MSQQLTVRNVPCAACPYRKNAPSGMWDAAEYQKLPEYDLPTALQPMATFLCHDADREHVLCRGWAEVHGDQERGCELLSLRIAASLGILDPALFPVACSGVPLHKSGLAACKAGLKAVRRPGANAIRMIDKLRKKHPELKSNEGNGQNDGSC